MRLHLIALCRPACPLSVEPARPWRQHRTRRATHPAGDSHRQTRITQRDLARARIACADGVIGQLCLLLICERHAQSRWKPGAKLFKIMRAGNLNTGKHEKRLQIFLDALLRIKQMTSVGQR